MNVDERLGAIRDRRERLLASRSAPNRFGRYWGMWQAHHARHRTIAEVDLLKIEAKHRLNLPASYRGFVRTIADGGIGPGEGMLDVKSAMSADALVGDPGATFLGGTLEHEGKPRPDGVLVLASIGNGDHHVMVVAGTHIGKVWSLGAGGFKPCLRRGQPTSFLDWYEAWLDLVKA